MINWKLIGNPINWFIVYGMVFFAAVAFALINKQLGNTP